METRFISKCASCGCYASALASHVNRADENLGGAFRDEKGESGEIGAIAIRCHKCGLARKARPVAARYNPEHKCNARCTSSHGFVCDCSCGGKNHGAAFGV